MELMMLLGHLVQVLHVLLVIAVMYLAIRFINHLWIGPTWLLIVFGSQLFTNGTCPLTVFSNSLLGKEYSSTLVWLADFIGIVASIVFFVFVIGGSMLAGGLVRNRKLRAAKLQKF